MKSLIIGKGFVGKYLEDLLGECLTYNLSDGQDIRNFEQLRNFLDYHRPDYIYHLAAQAFVGESFANPGRTFEVNVIGSLNLLEAVRQLGLKTKILLAGTSEEYGGGDNNEESKPEPKSPYAISKLAMDYLGQLYAKSYGLHVVVTRAFNHTGAGRGEMYAESAFAKQIAEVEKGKREYVQHGNLESIRNYTDVRDIVRAYLMAVDLPSGVYNICSDKNISMRDVMDMLIDSSPNPIPTKVNEALYRPVDFSFKEPSCEKFTKLTGWKPEIPLEITMKDLLEYWRERV